MAVWTDVESGLNKLMATIQREAQCYPDDLPVAPLFCRAWIDTDSASPEHICAKLTNHENRWVFNVLEEVLLRAKVPFEITARRERTISLEGSEAVLLQHVANATNYVSDTVIDFKWRHIVSGCVSHTERMFTKSGRDVVGVKARERSFFLAMNEEFVGKIRREVELQLLSKFDPGNVQPDAKGRDEGTREFAAATAIVEEVQRYMTDYNRRLPSHPLAVPDANKVAEFCKSFDEQLALKLQKLNEEIELGGGWSEQRREEQARSGKTQR